MYAGAGQDLQWACAPRILSTGWFDPIQAHVGGPLPLTRQLASPDFVDHPLEDLEKLVQPIILGQGV